VERLKAAAMRGTKAARSPLVSAKGPVLQLKMSCAEGLANWPPGPKSRTLFVTVPETVPKEAWVSTVRGVLL